MEGRTSTNRQKKLDTEPKFLFNVSMIKNVLLASLAFGLVGCALVFDPSGPKPKQNNSQLVQKTVVVDGCQYLETASAKIDWPNSVYSLTHKGNCTNEIHVPTNYTVNVLIVVAESEDGDSEYYYHSLTNRVKAALAH